MTDRIGNWQPKPETAAPPNSPRRPGDPIVAIGEVAVLPAHWTLTEHTLEDAVKRGDYKATEECLAMRSDLGIETDLKALLVLAANDPHYEMVALLLKHGAFQQLEPQEQQGMAPALQKLAHDALKARRFNIVELLAKHGVPIDRLWLRDACRKADLGAVKCLINCGVDVNRPFRNDVTPLVYALKGPSIETGTEAQLAVMKALLDGGADVNAKEWMWYGMTAIEHAVSRADSRVVVFLLDHGAALPPIRDFEAVLLTWCADLCTDNEKVGRLIHEALTNYLNQLGEDHHPPIQVERYVAKYNLRYEMAEMDPNSWTKSPGPVHFISTLHGPDAIKLASALALDPAGDMGQALEILHFVARKAAEQNVPAEDLQKLLNAVSELHEKLQDSLDPDVQKRAVALAGHLVRIGFQLNED